MLCQTCAPCDMTHPCHTWGSLPHWAVWRVSQNVITSCSTVPLIIWYHRSEIVMSWMIKFESNKNVSKCQTRSNTLTQKPTPANPCPVSCFVPEMRDIHKFQSNPLHPRMQADFVLHYPATGMGYLNISSTHTRQ